MENFRWHNLLECFLSIFIAMNVIGILPIYVSLVGNVIPKDRERIVRTAATVAFFITIAFAFIGKFIFDLVGITVPDFLVAGGIVLIVLSIGMLTETMYSRNISGTSIAAVPLGTPLLAGPGLLTTTLVLITIFNVPTILVALLLNILIAYLILCFSDFVVKLIGIEGTKAISKIASLLLVGLGVMLLRKGLVEIFSKF